MSDYTEVARVDVNTLVPERAVTADILRRPDFRVRCVTGCHAETYHQRWFECAGFSAYHIAFNPGHVVVIEERVAKPSPQLGQPIAWADHDRISGDGA